MSKPSSALIIDDEPDICELVSITLERMGLVVCTANDVEQALSLLKRQTFDLCLTDMRLPDGDGLDLIEFIQNHCPNTPIAMITAHGNMDTAVQAMKLGAFDFISKPIDIGHLRNLVRTAVKLSAEARTNKTTKLEFLGQSESIQQLRDTIDKIARSQAPVYIHGESGTGKELVAKLIHQQGPRANEPFVPVNCSAIPSELMESEFFGHKKGSFTGAVTDKPGLFQAANGGTLFLDEVADLSVAMQVKLLRAIQEKSIRPVGEQKEQKVDVRILSATHKNLDALVASGDFRQDLYYRINVIRLDVPPLRQRPDDIPLLAHSILERICESQGLDPITLSPSAQGLLQQYTFPGNVRELENVLERAATLCDNHKIDPDDLQLRPSQNPTAIPIPIDDATESALNASIAAVPANADPTGTLPLDNMLVQAEKESIEQALLQTRWNKTEAAKLLGISFRQLRYRIKKLGIE